VIADSEETMSARPGSVQPIKWPEGKTFAFSVFDDPDAQTLEGGKRVYDLLGDLGFRTTRGVWPGAAVRAPNSGGETCADTDYRRHSQSLQAAGFEIGYHNTTKHSSTRDETVRGLQAFEQYFGHAPRSMANHYNGEAIYWGPARVTPPVRHAYTIATLGRTRQRHFGDVEGHPYFWGDICRERIQYCRNFVYRDINTLAACPWMPYHDPQRSFVNAWYASTEGSNCSRFVGALSEANQDRLEANGGACLMYTHFGHGYEDGSSLTVRFRELMTRLSRKNGWFVPVSTLLDYIQAQRGGVVTIDPSSRYRLESRWLWEKTFRGTS
jgi:hypothetical protein